MLVVLLPDFVLFIAVLVMLLVAVVSVTVLLLVCNHLDFWHCLPDVTDVLFVPLSVMLVVLQQFLFFAVGGECSGGDDGLGPRGSCEYATGAAPCDSAVGRTGTWMIRCDCGA